VGLRVGARQFLGCGVSVTNVGRLQCRVSGVDVVIHDASAGKAERRASIRRPATYCRFGSRLKTESISPSIWVNCRVESAAKPAPIPMQMVGRTLPGLVSRQEALPAGRSSRQATTTATVAASRLNVSTSARVMLRPTATQIPAQITADAMTGTTPAPNANGMAGSSAR
jgi:hypothetical protein